MPTLKRKQIYIEPETFIALKKLSKLTNFSEAEHIRRAIKLYLSKQDFELGLDPILELLGLCKSRSGIPKNGSIKHDRYLYGEKIL